jgi:hypothetical protein
MLKSLVGVIHELPLLNSWRCLIYKTVTKVAVLFWHHPLSFLKRSANKNKYLCLNSPVKSVQSAA